MEQSRKSRCHVFDASLAPGELCNVWEFCEASALDRNQGNSPAVPADVRAVALTLLGQAIAQAQVDPQLCNVDPAEWWFQAVHLFDVSSSDLGNSVPSKILSRVLAAWVVRLKLATGTACAPGPDLRDLILCRASADSVTLGGQEFSWMEVLEEERNLLCFSVAAIPAPTVLCWTRLFLSRFEAAIAEDIHQLVGDALKLINRWGALLVQSAPAYTSASPKFFACGLCSLSLVVVGCITAEAFCPFEVDGASWSADLSAVFSATGVVATSRASLPDGLSSLELATENDADDLAFAVRAVAGAILAEFSAHALPA